MWCLMKGRGNVQRKKVKGGVFFELKVYGFGSSEQRFYLSRAIVSVNNMRIMGGIIVVACFPSKAYRKGAGVTNDFYFYHK